MATVNNVMCLFNIYVHTLSSITLSRLVPAIWKLVSLDDFSRSMKSLTLASYTHTKVMNECTGIHVHVHAVMLNSQVRHFCRNLASTSSSSTLKYPVPYNMGQIHRWSMTIVISHNQS
jgi:hypothetical protein